MLWRKFETDYYRIRINQVLVKHATKVAKLPWCGSIAEDFYKSINNKKYNSNEEVYPHY